MRKLHWGVIGAGGIADRRTIPAMMLSERSELTAVMEIDAGSKYGADAQKQLSYYD